MDRHRGGRLDELCGHDDGVDYLGILIYDI